MTSGSGGGMGEDGDEREADAGDWDRVEKDLRWCLVDGRGVEGKTVIFESLLMTDVERGSANLRSGFMMSFRDDEAIRNFATCRREDELRLFNTGRAILGMRPVGG